MSTTRDSDIRVLIIAEAANPEWVSVPLVGWRHARALLDVVNGHLVTQVRNREAILRAGLTEDREFTSIDSEAVARSLWRIGRVLRGGSGSAWTTNTALQTIAYYHFERLVWKRFRQAIRSGAYDIVHRITPLSPATPSRMAAWCRRAGVPFVLGPLNGGVPWPQGFELERKREREWLSKLRGAHRFLPGYRATRAHSSAILVGSQVTMNEMPDSARDRCIYLPENAIDSSGFAHIQPKTPSRPIRMLFVGRLVPLKGLDLLIEAAEGFLSKGDLTMTIVGDGPDRTRLEELVGSKQLTPSVTFAGWVDHKQLPAHMANADILALPSIREFGGGVVLEAMAAGLPALVLDYGGPGELVSSSTGYAIPIGTRHEIMNGLRTTMDQIIRRPSQLREKGDAARIRVNALFTWQAKAAMTREVYRWVLGRADDRPSFPFDQD